MKHFALSVILAMLFLPGQLFAAPSYLDAFPTILRDWVPLSITVTMIVIILHGLIYGFAKGFYQHELEVYAKSEILQAFATFFIIIFMATILGSLNSPDTMRGLIGGDVPCGDSVVSVQNIGTAMNLIKCKIADKASSLASLQESAYNAAKGVSALLSWYNSIYGIPVFQGIWVTSWFKELENYRIIYNVTTSMLISLNAQIKFVDYVQNNMLAFFLPVGIILRAFHFTRGIGAFFISIAFGLYFIFPILFTITDPGFVKFPPPTNSPIEIPNFCYPTFSGIASIASSIPLGSGAGGGFGLDIKSASSEISKVYTGIIIHPLVSLAITLVFVRYIMYLFGGEPYELMRYVARVV